MKKFLIFILAYHILTSLAYAEISNEVLLERINANAEIIKTIAEATEANTEAIKMLQKETEQLREDFQKETKQLREDMIMLRGDVKELWREVGNLREEMNKRLEFIQNLLIALIVAVIFVLGAYFFFRWWDSRETKTQK